jgi:hypothetical protein
MKNFFVSKSDKNRVAFIEKAIATIQPDLVYIVCEKNRIDVYKGINAVVLPMKELNKCENWIHFVNNFTNHSLLVIDNVLKFMFFGDGKKEYLKNFAQRVQHCIVTDVVPFYTEPYEIFYPFYFLGKEILGYNSYNTFKANHFEEKQDGEIGYAHSFEVLREKMKDYYVQDYKEFFKERTILEWSISESETSQYLELKDKIKSADSFNPIKSITKVADFVNLTNTKAALVNELLGTLQGRKAIVLNTLMYAKAISGKLKRKNYEIISYHEENLEKFSNYDSIIFYDNIIIKPHNVFYIEPFIKGNCYILLEKTTNVDSYLFNRVHHNDLRKKLSLFYDKRNSAQ